jgi:primosomal protein N' (replication factor Y)
MPTVQIVDVRRGEERLRQGRYIARTLEIRIREALRENGQVILLQNRRGFATSVACPRCGWILECPECDVSLTYHRSHALALCHLCGHEARCPPNCPDCALPALKMRGVGTQTVEQELAQTFPDATVARMDSDTMATREAYEEVLGRFGRHEIDILVGTQMIAKGLHFPRVTLVGIVSADTALVLPDFRSAERTFALVAQVAGRAGRGDAPGRVVVQTTMPDHSAIRLAAEHDYETFATAETADRKRYGYPPWRRLLRVVVRGRDERAVEARIAETAGRLVAAAVDGVDLLGPATPSIARIQGRHRRHLLAKCPTSREVAMLLHVLRRARRPGREVEETWDVDPYQVL